MHSSVTVTGALRRFIGEYRRLHSPSHHQNRVLDWLCACRTAQCRGGLRAEWLAARQDQLLPVPHFQVVFTLPGALRSLALGNPRVVYGLLFRAAAETLRQLGAQKSASR